MAFSPKKIAICKPYFEPKYNVKLIIIKTLIIFRDGSYKYILPKLLSKNYCVKKNYCKNQRYSYYSSSVVFMLPKLLKKVKIK